MACFCCSVPQRAAHLCKKSRYFQEVDGVASKLKGEDKSEGKREEQDNSP